MKLNFTYYAAVIQLRIQNCVILIVQLRRVVRNLCNTVVKLFSTEYQYPAILIRLTRSTTAAAYDGKVTFKLDKLVFYIDRSNKSADVWLALFSNQPIRQK
ncbi:Gilatoxin [Trichinella spiralis]|uniref:Gilatoxin n=1 Tax=Trichinella spiralis TaxID=6334 RepID=A0ABR3K6J8_TRISP